VDDPLEEPLRARLEGDHHAADRTVAYVSWTCGRTAGRRGSLRRLLQAGAHLQELPPERPEFIGRPVQHVPVGVDRLLDRVGEVAQRRNPVRVWASRGYFPRRSSKNRRTRSPTRAVLPIRSSSVGRGRRPWPPSRPPRGSPSPRPAEGPHRAEASAAVAVLSSDARMESRSIPERAPRTGRAPAPRRRGPTSRP